MTCTTEETFKTKRLGQECQILQKGQVRQRQKWNLTTIWWQSFLKWILVSNEGAGLHLLVTNENVKCVKSELSITQVGNTNELT